jgi:glycosyltransferase involved in cell wall biosynthesis
VARLRPDVVHVEWNTTAKRYLPFIEAWRGPVVVSCHGTGIHLRPYVPPTDSEREELRASLRAATVVHCVSESMVREATALGMPPTAARLIRPAVDPDEFRPVPRRRETHELRVVGVGRMRWSKAWELAILAVRNCRASGVPARLDLLGGWHSSEHSAEELGEQERLRWAVADLELEGLVRLHGAVPSSTVRDTLQRSDVLIHPSLAESTPTVVLEAMACELPVVVADVGGVREAVTDGVEGFVVPPRDPDAMAEALRTLWVDPELGPRMGRAGRARVQARFRLDHQVDAFQALYRELTEKHAAPLAPIAHPGPPPSSGASPPPADGRALRMLSAGRLEWPQGYEYAIEAVRLLADRGVPCAYRIVGEGQLLPALAFARHQLGVGQVDLAGAAGPAGLDDHLAWAEVFVHPSVVDGVPDEVVRAHAAGLPVVMTDPGDGVEHPPRADVVPRRDPGAIADALETLAVRLSPPTIACR